MSVDFEIFVVYNVNVNGYISDFVVELDEKGDVFMKFSVALQVYSVRDFAEKDLEGTLKKLRKWAMTA